MTQAPTQRQAPAQAHDEPVPEKGAQYQSDLDRLIQQPIANMRSIYAGEDQSFDTYDGRHIMLNVNMLRTVLPEAFRLATKEEVAAFVHYCMTNRLDPFRKQVHFIKYSDREPAAFVTAWTVFIDRANRHPMFDGFESGIVWHVRVGDAVTVVRGQPCEYTPDENHIIVGGWARGHRKDQRFPRYVEVPLEEMQAKKYDKEKGFKVPTRMWTEATTTMATKTPAARCIRLLFPDELGTLVSEDEVLTPSAAQATAEGKAAFKEFLEKPKGPGGKAGADAPPADGPDGFQPPPPAPKPAQGKRTKI